jgi:hypothetical protein
MANKNDTVVRGRYNSAAPTPASGDAVEFQFDSSGNLKVTMAGVTINASDIEIGAVELKNGADDTRAVIGANGLEVNVKAMIALPAGTNNIGDVDVLTLPALPAGTNNIGDVDVLTMPANVRTTDTISAALATDAIMNNATALTPKFAAIVASASGNTSIVALVSAKKIRVLGLCFTVNGAVNVKWQSNTTDKTGLFYGDAAGKGKVLPFNPLGWFETAAGEALNINLSGAVAVGGELVYCEV